VTKLPKVSPAPEASRCERVARFRDVLNILVQ
jgi:hypothetical protein